MRLIAASIITMLLTLTFCLYLYYRAAPNPLIEKAIVLQGQEINRILSDIQRLDNQDAELLVEISYIKGENKRLEKINDALEGTLKEYKKQEKDQ